jgi:hypothetical protein
VKITVDNSKAVRVSHKKKHKSSSHSPKRKDKEKEKEKDKEKVLSIGCSHPRNIKYQSRSKG